MYKITILEIGTFFTIIGGIIGVVMFFIGRQSAAKNEGISKGRLLGDIEYIRASIDELKNEFRLANIPGLRARILTLEKYSNKHERDFTRIHERIDKIGGKPGGIKNESG